MAIAGLRLNGRGGGGLGELIHGIGRFGGGGGAPTHHPLKSFDLSLKKHQAAACTMCTGGRLYTVGSSVQKRLHGPLVCERHWLHCKETIDSVRALDFCTDFRTRSMRLEKACSDVLNAALPTGWVKNKACDH